jgi:hypothetical protein
MAPTKAKARYAATTLSLRAIGPIDVMGKPPWLTSLPALTLKGSNRSPRKKSALLLYRCIRTPKRSGNVVKES